MERSTPISPGSCLIGLIASGLLVVLVGCDEERLKTTDQSHAVVAVGRRESPAGEVQPRLTQIAQRLEGIEERLKEVGHDVQPTAAAGAVTPRAVARRAAARDSIRLPSEPLKGRIVFEEKHCVRCHSISGAGGSSGPDLAKTYFQGSFLDLACMLWNHIPDMVVEYKALNLAQPKFTDEEITSLISYLYYLRYLGNPGNVSDGEQLLKTKGCLTCHVAGQEPGENVGPGLDQITKYASPIYMAQAIWNHEPQMQAMMDKMGVVRPTFDGQEISDLSAYVRAVSRWTNQERAYLSPGNPRQGKKVFQDKGCVNCHSGSQTGGQGPILEDLPLHKNAADIAGMMWNHGDTMLRTMRAGQIPWPTFEGKEMADLIAYLYFAKFIEPAGEAASGKTLFQERQCSSCHSIKGVGGNLGPDLAESQSLSSEVTTLRAMLNHSEEMYETVLSKGKVWPLLNGKEMRDIFAYLGAVSGARADLLADARAPRGGQVVIDSQRLTQWIESSQEPAPDEPKPDEPTPDEPTPDQPKPDEPKPEEPIPPVKITVGPDASDVLKKLEIVDAFLLNTPGENYIEKLENALGSEQARHVVLAFNLDPECISVGDFTWSPRNTRGAKVLRIFIPTMLQAQVTVTLNGRTVWKPEALDGLNVLSPEIHSDADPVELSIEVEDRGVGDACGGVDDIYVLRPRPRGQ